jgi:drug/metabolite transporter (DMT)-like permease
MRDLPFFVLFGLISGAFNYLAYFIALHHLGAILATTLFYTYPAMAALLAAIFLKEPLSWSKAFPILVTVLGCALVAGLFGPAEYALRPDGIVWALLAAATAAAYPIFGRRAMLRHSPWTTLFYSIALGSLFLDLFWAGSCVLFSGAGELCGTLPTLTQADASFWGGVLYLAIGPTLGGYMTYLLSIRRLEVRQASLVTAIELIVAALLAYLFLGERPTIPQWIGAGLILVAVLWVRLERSSRT